VSLKIEGKWVVGAPKSLDFSWPFGHFHLPIGSWVSGIEIRARAITTAKMAGKFKLGSRDFTTSPVSRKSLSPGRNRRTEMPVQ